ncbi:MAG: hypothetical protein ACI4SB_06500, partial [Acutalibacteraceae bacterium]
MKYLRKEIDFNPVSAVETPTGTGKKRLEAIDSEQMKWIVETDELPEAQVAAMIMLSAGLRRGELIALTWTDVDLKANHNHPSNGWFAQGLKATD